MLQRQVRSINENGWFDQQTCNDEGEECADEEGEEKAVHFVKASRRGRALLPKGRRDREVPPTSWCAGISFAIVVVRAVVPDTLG